MLLVLVMFGTARPILANAPRLVQFWQNLQTSLVLLIPNCTRQLMITYTNTMKFIILYKSGEYN